MQFCKLKSLANRLFLTWNLPSTTDVGDVLPYSRVPWFSHCINKVNQRSKPKWLNWNESLLLGLKGKEDFLSHQLTLTETLQFLLGLSVKFLNSGYLPQGWRTVGCSCPQPSQPCRRWGAPTPCLCILQTWAKTWFYFSEQFTTSPKNEIWPPGGY